MVNRALILILMWDVFFLASIVLIIYHLLKSRTKETNTNNG